MDKRVIVMKNKNPEASQIKDSGFLLNQQL